MIPKLYNSRAEEMWAFITDDTSFKGKTVIDVGCGHGDFCYLSQRQGASFVLGVDKDPYAVMDAMQKYPGIYWTVSDFDDDSYPFAQYDIALCFSVLPYSSDKPKFIDKLSWLAKTVFFEVQYEGDGIGTIKDDDDMRRTLFQWWRNVNKVGSTYIKGRDKWRSIWKLTEGIKWETSEF